MTFSRNLSLGYNTSLTKCSLKLNVIVYRELMNKSDGIHLSEFNETFECAFFFLSNLEKYQDLFKFCLNKLIIGLHKKLLFKGSSQHVRSIM